MEGSDQMRPRVKYCQSSWSRRRLSGDGVLLGIKVVMGSLDFTASGF